MQALATPCRDNALSTDSAQSHIYLVVGWVRVTARDSAQSHVYLVVGWARFTATDSAQSHVYLAVGLVRVKASASGSSEGDNVATANGTFRR
jgi:hypothetical protein